MFVCPENGHSASVFSRTETSLSDRRVFSSGIVVSQHPFLGTVLGGDVVLLPPVWLVGTVCIHTGACQCTPGVHRSVHWSRGCVLFFHSDKQQRLLFSRCPFLREQVKRPCLCFATEESVGF